MAQLPAMNTPQFTWRRAKMPRHPQPVPPIFQPEVAAQRIVWAFHHRRREVFAGAPTMVAIEGNKIAPALADHYLGRTRFDSQQTQDPLSPGRRDNLFEPLPGDFGAHGVFDKEAMNAAGRNWIGAHKGTTLIAGATVFGALAFALKRRPS
jgi:hypothetical protein